MIRSSLARLKALAGTGPVAARIHYLVLAGIILVGAYLRLTGLRRQSLWFDEVDVVVRAQRPLGQVLSTFTATGENGPLYNILLAIWIRIAGISEIAVRFPSAVTGVLALPVIYLLARRLAGSTVALIATALLAISPYHIWYSQEAKMYTMVVLLALLSTLLLVEALSRNRLIWWAGYVVVTTLMFYTHVATILVFVAQTGYVLLTLRHWRDRARPWLASAALLTLPYVPIALWALRVVAGEAVTWQPDVSLTEAVRIIGVKFAANRSEPDVEFRAATLYITLALGGAAGLLWRGDRRHWGLLLVGLALIPVVGLYLVSLRNSVFSDRYALVALPAYLILVATGVTLLIRSRLVWPAGLASMVLILAFAWVPIEDVNRSTNAEKEDWRSAYADVARRAQPGDVLLVHPGYIITTYTYYSQREPELQQYPVVTIPTFRVQWLDRQLMVQMIREEVGPATRFWLIQSPTRVPPEDPNHTLESWLEEAGSEQYDREFNGVRVTLYQVPARDRAGSGSD